MNNGGMMDRKRASAFHSRRLELCLWAGHVRSAIRSLSKGVREVEAKIQEAVDSGNEEYAQFVMDTDVDIIEELIGAAAVMCQRHATNVVSTARSALRFAGIDDPNGGRDWKNYHLFCLGDCLPSISARTAMTLLNDTANYYKHRDEWDVDWTRLRGNARRTADGVALLGVSGTGNGNLRTISEAFGNPEYEKLGILLGVVESWAERVVKYCRSKLK